jgi:hypothetical protein
MSRKNIVKEVITLPKSNFDPSNIVHPKILV